MKTKFPELKQELKLLALKIRELKSQRKTSSHGYVHGLSFAQHEYRVDHVVYCMAHGTPYERIESPTNADELDMTKIELKVQELKEKRDEAIRARLQQTA